MSLTVALPSTLTAETSTLREKTVKMGFIARVLAVFKVDQVVLYCDDVSYIEDQRLMKKLLDYAVCPQYLRKKFFPLDPHLKYVGLMPPLRTPNHPLEKNIRDLPNLSYREGLVVKRLDEEKYLVDVGLDKPIAVKGGKLREGMRVIVEIRKDEEEVKAKLVARRDVPFYFGFRVQSTRGGLREVVERYGKEALVIATSKYGKSIVEIVEELQQELSTRSNILLLFGSPLRGLYDIAKREGCDLDSIVDHVVNFIPGQGTETVRTEEALCAVLAVINVLLRLKPLTK